MNEFKRVASFLSTETLSTTNRRSSFGAISPILPVQKSSNNGGLLPKIIIDDQCRSSNVLTSIATLKSDLYSTSSYTSVFSGIFLKQRKFSGSCLESFIGNRLCLSSRNGENDERDAIKAHRRASCGPTIQLMKSPQPFTISNAKESLNSTILRSKCFELPISPLDGKTTSQKHKFNAENSLNSFCRVSASHSPSLSPCLEDKSQYNRKHFSFKGSPIEQLHTKRLLRQNGPKSKRSIYGHTSVKSSRLALKRYSDTSNYHSSDKWAYYHWRKTSLEEIKVRCNSRRKKRMSSSFNISLALNTCHRQLSYGKILGKGGFGCVKVGKFNGDKAAIKFLLGHRAMTSINNELLAISIPAHPNVVLINAIVTSHKTCTDLVNVYSKTKSIESLSIKEVMDFLGLKNSDLPKKIFDTDLPPEPWAWIIAELCSSTNLLSIINNSILYVSTRVKIKYSY